MYIKHKCCGVITVSRSEQLREGEKKRGERIGVLRKQTGTSKS
jgi:hypothetical protein